MAEKAFFQSGGHSLAGLIDLPQKLPAPAAILCHGYTNSKDDCPLFVDITKRLLDNGMIVFRFDQFGSGDSPGLFKDKLTSILVQNAQDALDFLAADARVDKSRIGMLGISTGGVLLTLMGNDPRIKATVMISPSFNLVREFAGERATLKDGYANLGCDPQTKKASTGQTKGELLMSKLFFDELPGLDDKAKVILRQMKNVLVLFGADDQLVKPLCGQEIIDLVGDPKELHLIPGAGHNCSKKPNEAVDLSVDWLARSLK
jgi:alpha-beta hydrolase superfamily lysophospholipase